MGVQLLFQFDQLMRQFLMGGQIFAESDKSPDDINADVDGFGCVEAAGGHDGAVFGEGKRAFAATAPTWVDIANCDFKISNSSRDN